MKEKLIREYKELQNTFIENAKRGIELRKEYERVKEVEKDLSSKVTLLEKLTEMSVEELSLAAKELDNEETSTNNTGNDNDDSVCNDTKPRKRKSRTKSV